VIGIPEIQRFDENARLRRKSRGGLSKKEKLMNCHYRHAILYRASGARMFAVRISVLFIGIVGASHLILEAAPVTFEFDATVASPNVGTGNTNLRFTISPGDPIVGSISFEPEGDGPLFPQSGKMRFEIGGASLEVSGFQIIVENDAGLWIE
jgi:hypothetical protein